ncbi:uncharacterized protein LACBIDRAFT_304295 [Laccaria bicolor S238N-H82]|uniref:Predicted protein n=1 Tax=Laccaria bicolor (strain S238N-H82 / ATCC MYA-4686) TaxID=486041 RepID=B0DLB3_LACBS|nr:uncharacterized protein LACBIDRAFT_304295 [Laccaria bicolor S238N-H82]EDR04622.1 predicted protein [Laccaria bicolor S238N-H82]|eukprot:XP_001884794.1 predicted protein [Laccaria bicolor S238N-H82]
MKWFIDLSFPTFPIYSHLFSRSASRQYDQMSFPSFPNAEDRSESRSDTYPPPSATTLSIRRNGEELHKCSQVWSMQ